MKRIAAILVVLSLASTTLFAQQAQHANGEGAGRGAEHRQQVQAMKIGYITEQIDLTPEQSVVFWPLYNEYWAARHDVFRRKRELHRRINTEVVDQQAIDDLLQIESDQASVMRLFVPRFQKIISTNQTAKLFVAEESFKSQLLKTLRK